MFKKGMWLICIDPGEFFQDLTKGKLYQCKNNPERAGYVHVIPDPGGLGGWKQERFKMAEPLARPEIKEVIISNGEISYA